MRAVVQRQYGAADVLELRDVAKPTMGPDEVLVKVRAAGVNPADWHHMTGKPYLVRLTDGLSKPKTEVFGIDLAGEVESVGPNVTSLKAGDRVFGENSRAYAEFACAPEGRLAIIPPDISFEQAAAVPIAGLTALQGLRDKGGIKKGHSVLINGASGGVGTFAIQIAKSYGAEVTAVCSNRNLEMVQRLGADSVIDYTDVTKHGGDFTAAAELAGQTFDIILDNVGNQPITRCRRILKPTGSYVGVGAPDGDWIGPLVHIGKVALGSLLGKPKMQVMLAKQTKQDLEVLCGLLSSGAVIPEIERTFTLDEVRDALKHQESGRVRGKIVLTA